MIVPMLPKIPRGDSLRARSKAAEGGNDATAARLSRITAASIASVTASILLSMFTGWLPMLPKVSEVALPAEISRAPPTRGRMPPVTCCMTIPADDAVNAFEPRACCLYM